MSTAPLCTVDDIADGGSVALVAEIGGRRVPAMAVRRGERVYVYRNVCPHNGVPLDFPPGQFISDDGAYIECSSHGALFGIEDGVCIVGPCADEALTKIDVEVRDGAVYLR